MVIEIRNQHFRLLSQKAICWEEEKTLLISDLHLGKIMHFRKEGIAIPAVALENNFKRLDEIILKNNICRILFLWDLFHNSVNTEWERFRQWRKKYQSMEMVNVMGNHDILPRDLYTENKIDVFIHSFREKEFLFSHHPKKEFEENTFTFCGHIHPVFVLRSNVRQSIKLPCFVIDKNQAVLPSFGVFTGGYEVMLIENRKIFLVMENEVIGI
jgi:DNA ligase-associated metallophosphoesterase